MGLVEPRFHLQGDPGYSAVPLWHWPPAAVFSTLSCCSPSSGVSQELLPRGILQGGQGCPFPLGNFPPDFYIEGLEVKGSKAPEAN